MKFSISRASINRGKPVPTAYKESRNTEWCVDIPDLASFLAFVEEQGDVAICVSRDKGTLDAALMIYDAYIE